MPLTLDLFVGWYLALRQIRRASRWTTVLIIFVMFLTFLNLVVVTGILVGLIEGINGSYRAQYTGDLLVSALATKEYIEETPSIIALLQSLPQVESFSTRYQAGGTIEANYLTHTDASEKADATGAQIVGIDPEAEDAFSGLARRVVAGAYLAPGDYDQVMVGSLLLAQYAFGNQPGLTPLVGVVPGAKIRLTVGGASRDVVVKGIVKSKIAPLAASVFITDTELKSLIGRSDNNAAQIAVRLRPGTDPIALKRLLLASGVEERARVETLADAIPNGVADIKNTFAMLGNLLSSVGLVVAAITIFIVVFINALTHRKFIGILKGIGISGRAIEISYVIQSLFYALVGSTVGLMTLYAFLVPFVAAHPLNFPFSDGILVAPLPETLLRVALLVFATLIAGYIPARMIVQKNTLDSILGRN